jgi:hypothetical protein
MSIKAVKILGLMLVIALWAGNCQGQMENESNNDAALNSESTDLNYIWSVTGIEEDGQVIMLLHQEGEDLYGQAKFEPDSGQAWNGLVVGMIEDENVSLALTAQKGDALCGCRLIGKYDPASESISGDLLQVCDGNITRRGKFQAIWINPDLTSYTPAVVEPTGSAEPWSQSAEASKTGETALTEASAASPSPDSEKSRFHDVRQDADRILTGVGDISQIPIGMGGSGLP